MSNQSKVGAIGLTPEEQAIVEQMTFDQGTLTTKTGVRNGELACRLMKMLLARDAIPAQRLRYFDDPDYRSGATKGSRQQLFERNKTTGDDIYRHANFLDYMRYFIFGTDLPPSIIDQFSTKAFAFGHVGPSDALELGKLAREMTRKHGLQPRNAADEFHRLALDCGIYHGHADRIRSVVHNTR
jgi:hypothetical protein